MNGPPKDGRALRLAAAHCTHPDVDLTDGALLFYLADYANWNTYGAARPGNRNLMGFLRVTTSRAVEKRIASNIKRGLITRTEVGNGQGHASVYQLNLSSSHFPDQTPNGEWLIKPQNGKTVEETPNHTDGVSEETPKETPNHKVSNPERETNEPRTGDERTPNHKVANPEPVVRHNKYSTKEQQENNKPPTPAPRNEKSVPIAAKPRKGAGGGNSSPANAGSNQENDWEEFSKRLPQAMADSDYWRKDNERGELRKKVEDDGWEVVHIAVKDYYHNGPSSENDKYKWTSFLSNYAYWRAKVTEARLEEFRKQCYLATPEGKAEDDAKWTARGDKNKAEALDELEPMRPFTAEEERWIQEWADKIDNAPTRDDKSAAYWRCQEWYWVTKSGAASYETLASRFDWTFREPIRARKKRDEEARVLAEFIGENGHSPDESYID